MTSEGLTVPAVSAPAGGGVSAPVAGGGRSRVRKAAVLADQVVSSGSNFVVLALVARGTGPDGYAVFAGAMAVWLLLLALTRAAITEPMVLRAPTEPGAYAAGWRHALRAAAVGSPSALAVAGILHLAGAPGDAVGAAAGLAVAAPCLLLQDLTRWRFLSARDGVGALRSDSVFAVVEIVLLVVLLATDRLTVGAAMAAIGVGAGVAAALDARRLGLSWGLRAPIEPVRARDSLPGWLLLDAGGTWVNAQAPVLLLTWILTAESAGLYRAAFDVFGPLRVLQLSLVAVLLPAGAAAFAGSGMAALKRQLLRASTAVAGLSVLFGAAAVWLGPALVRRTYGSEFDIERDLVLLVALAAGLNTVHIVQITGIKAMQRARALAVARIWTTVAGTTTMVVLGIVAGLDGAAAGLALAALLRVVVLGVLLVSRPEGRHAR